MYPDMVQWEWQFSSMHQINGGTFCKTQLVVSKTAKVMKNEEDLQTCHKSWETKSTCKQLHGLWWSGGDPGREKEHSWENWWNLKMSLVSLIVMHQCQFLSFDPFATVMQDVNTGKAGWRPYGNWLFCLCKLF